jgi:predicted Zn-dependent peptidase
LVLVLVLACSVQANAQESEQRNLFQHIETRELANGLRVHRVAVPGDPLTRTSLTVPVGRDHDPTGQEEMAHLLEHILLAVDQGQTEEEFQAEILDVGGGFNGFTSGRRTHYYVSLAQDQGLKGIDWLYRAIRPKVITLEDLRTQRDPVLLEVDARHWTLADHVANWWLNPPALRPPGFWRYWFDLPQPRRERLYNPFVSVREITPEGLRIFYETWYSPQTMTLTIAGDLNADAVWKQVQATWALLPARPVPTDPFHPVLTDQPRQSTWFQVRSEVSYSRDLLLTGLTGEELLTLLYIKSWLQQRLQRALRHGAEKSTYSVRVSTYLKGEAYDLEINLEIDPDRYDEATQLIEAEILALESGSTPDEVWHEERAEMIRRLLTNSQQSEVFTSAVRRVFFRRDLFPGYPDLARIYRDMTPQRVSSFLTEHHSAAHDGLRLWRPLPVSPVLVGVAYILVLLGVWWYTLTHWRRPLDMSRLRYVARVRISIVEKGLLFLGLLGALTVVAGLRQAWIWGYWAWVATADTFVVRLGADLVTLFLATWALAWLSSRVPRKLLVFEHGVALKCLWVRATWVAKEQIETIELLTLTQARARGPVLPLTLGKGVLMRHATGRAWFLRTRDVPELMRVLEKQGYPGDQIDRS